MKAEDKQRMLNRLLLGVPTDTVARRELEKVQLEDLDAIEPIIDEVIRREVKRFGEHIFHNVLTPQQCIEVYERLKTEGRLSQKTIHLHEGMDKGQAQEVKP
jgi:hypothetical protein